MIKTFLGIDAGIENVGYALAINNDEISEQKYQVVKTNGRQVMGVLSFDAAEPAVARRMHRAMRRRLDRRRYRISLLQEIFNDDLMSKDKNFLRRLNENDLCSEDRSVDGKYSLFNDSTFNDVIYYKKYPTIYHLRNELMTKGTDDIRLLYLAIHHIIKYRGHFLLTGDINASEVGGVNQLKEMVEKLNNKLFENCESDECLDCLSVQNLQYIKDLICGTGKITENLLKNITTGKKFVSKKDKKNKMIELFEAKSSVAKKIVDIIMGGKVNLFDLFGEVNYSKEQVKGFTMADEWETIEDLQLLKDNMLHSDIINNIKEIYDWVALNELLKGEKSLSSAMINIYETHKQDLRDLKNFIKKYKFDKYDEVFNEQKDDKGKVNSKLNNYAQYIGGGRFEGVKVGANGRLGLTCSQEDFYSYIKKIINAVEVEEAQIQKQSLLDKIDSKMFMPKIVSKNNSTLPYQLNMMELDKILEVAKKNPSFAFLKDISDNMTNADKIKALLSFRIPYFIGPVKEYSESDENNKFAWSVRKESGRITPWNIENKIDYKQSNEQFIRRMTNKCTYLRIADTLPKNSILFSKFMCLNELNCLKINGDEISSELKKEIFNNVYYQKNPTVKKIKRYLVSNYPDYDKDLILSGIDTELKSNMNTYLLYKDKLGDKVDKDIAMVERIIFLSTIHNDSKMLEESIREEFENKLSEDEIKSIKGFKFNGWGSLSAEFLAGYKNNGIHLTFDGEMLDIIDIMYEYNYNLQQILYNPRCKYEDAIKEYFIAKGVLEDDETKFEDNIEEYNCSPTVKKCVRQSLKLVKDIVKQTKTIPDIIFLESCRDNNDFKKGQRTLKRRDKIKAVYDDAKKCIKQLLKEKNGEFKKEDLTDLSECIVDCEVKLNNYNDICLKKENLYLYFMQLGKDMYTGKPIDLDAVLSGNKYDHDHIIPQAVLKDDSFTNLVLVEKKQNAEKSREYPLPPQFRQPHLWKMLYKIGLLSSEKYARLIRKNQITIDEQERFVNRQLVETSQTVVILRDVLTRYFASITDKKVEIVLSKAGNVSMFRKEFGLTKSREVNDFHHAWDAYLNIVVGDILNKTFNQSWYKKYDNGKDKSYNFLRVLKKQVTANNDEILNNIKNLMNSADFQMVKLPVTNKGAFYSEVLKRAENDKNSKLIAACDSKVVNGIETNPKCNTQKYGGYKTANTAYFAIADSVGNGNEKKRNIVAISILDDARIKLGKLSYEQVFENVGLKNAELAKIDGMNKPFIKIGALIDFGAYRLRLAGMTGKYLQFHNANQLYVTEEQNRYIKELSMLIDKVSKATKKDAKNEEKNDLVKEIVNENIRRKDSSQNKNDNIIIVNKQDNVKMYEFFIDKLSHHPYKNIPGYYNLFNILDRARDDFNKKNLYTQVSLLLNIIKAFQCNALDVNVKELCYIDEKGKEKKGGEHQCNITKNSDITNDKNIYLINQSMSGLKEKRIKLTLDK